MYRATERVSETSVAQCYSYPSRVLLIVALFAHAFSPSPVSAGSARLASLSLNTPTPLPSPGLHGSALASSLGASPISPIDTPKASDSAQLQPSPSNLSLARPPVLYGSLGTKGASLQESTTPTAGTSSSSAVGVSTASPTYASVASSRLGDDDNGSPSSGSTDKDPTPTQSKMGSYQMPASGSVVPEAEAESSTSTSADPTPSPEVLLERKEAHQEAVRQRIRALGDEAGGLDSDEEEEALVQAQIAAEEEEAAKERERRRREEEQERQDEEANERTSLLGGRMLKTSTSFADLQVLGAAKRTFGGWLDQARKKSKSVSVSKEDLVDAAKISVQSIPAVILGYALLLGRLRISVSDTASPTESS